MPFDGKCPICLGEFLPEQISALKCGHTFHLECILEWLQMSKTCPECREPFTKETVIRKLYFDKGDVSQFLNTSKADNEITELAQALAEEQTAHGKTMEELQTIKKLKEKLEALYGQEKATKEKLDSQLARKELMLQEKQRLLQRFEARMKTSELEHLETVKMLNKAYSRSLKERLDLEAKLYGHIRPNSCLNNEITNLRGNNPQLLSNPKSKAAFPSSNSAGVPKAVTQAESEANGMSPNNRGVRIPETVTRRVHPLPRKNNSGLGSVAKPQLRPTNKVSMKRLVYAPSGKIPTKQKPASNVAAARSVTVEAPLAMDEGVICLD